MGVVYTHYLLPRPASYRPEAKDLALFVKRLGDDNWIFTSESLANYPRDLLDRAARETGAYWIDVQAWQKMPVPFPVTADWLGQIKQVEFGLSWTVGSLRRSGLRYPFERLYSDSEEQGQDLYFKININSSSDYVYQIGELIEPFDTATCPCGKDLRYEIERRYLFGTPARISSKCPVCGAVFDPTDLPAAIKSPYDLSRRAFPGGAAYRFAVEIYCDKSWPGRNDNNEIAVDPRLARLCEETFGCRFVEAADAG